MYEDNTPRVLHLIALHTVDKIDNVEWRNSKEGRKFLGKLKEEKMSKTVKEAVAAKTIWAISNQPIRAKNLCGGRFINWFDQEFNLSGLDKK